MELAALGLLCWICMSPSGVVMDREKETMVGGGAFQASGHNPTGSLKIHILKRIRKEYYISVCHTLKGHCHMKILLQACLCMFSMDHGKKLWKSLLLWAIVFCAIPRFIPFPLVTALQYSFQQGKEPMFLIGYSLGWTVSLHVLLV
jgi:hypothetical protein